jgi:hypothetical protein
MSHVTNIFTLGSLEEEEEEEEEFTQNRFV